MRTIWSFDMPVDDRRTITMPEGAHVIALGKHSPTLLRMWAEVVTDRPSEERTFLVVGTGNPIPETAGRYLGTVQALPFVWHVFEEER